MKSWKPLVFLFLCTPALVSCGNSKDAVTIYVLTPPQKAALFTQDLAVIAKRHGLDPNLGQSTGDKNLKYRVIEADGRWLWLWGTNVPLDKYASPILCGHYAQGHPDPGQYIVTIDHGLVRIGLNHVLAVIASGRPRALMSEVSKDLKASGYTVRSSPAVCSPLSKIGAPHGY